MSSTTPARSDRAHSARRPAPLWPRAFFAALVVILTASAAVAQQEKAMARWQEVDQLVDEQKYQAAAAITEE
ncbi:MAG: hypothetical protein AAFY88_00755, partial [Acidobacteriota bacterium]